ncbi:MAG: carbohydrate kinase family protein [Promethearchaeota archaeon]|nr:MAG: carbohydrate kinase family protein [Candidatus Lokiarchaeota archaeon]
MSSIKKKIIVLGSIAFDYIMGFAENFVNAVSIDHEKGEYQSTVTADSRIQYFGGTAGNIAYNLGILNAKDTEIHLLGSVGKDFDGLGYKDHIGRFENINLGVDVHDDLFTAACYIVNDPKSNQMIIFHGGALDKCKDIDLRDKIKDPENYIHAINSTQSVDAMANFSEQLFDLKIPQIFDPGQVTPLFPKELLIDILKKTEILIGNKYEFEQVINKTELTEEQILKRVKAIIKTKGAEGSELLYKDDKEKLYRVNIPICVPEKVIDTTGAGDGYRAGILTGLSLDMTLLDSCRLGSVIGSFVVETSGAQTQRYYLEDVRKRFMQNYKYIPQELEGL